MKKDSKKSIEDFKELEIPASDQIQIKGGEEIIVEEDIIG